METLLILTNLPDETTARNLAAHLVESRLAACVNIMAPCRSVYYWHGRLEETSEVPLLIKATSSSYAALEAAVREHHPYELPEIIAVPVTRGLPAYLEWVASETTPLSTQIELC